MRPFFAAALCAVVASHGRAQESLKVDVLKEPAPASASAAIRGELSEHGVRIRDEAGKTFADIWLRKLIPASEKPAGAKGAVQFPFLADGELLGLCQFAVEGHD